MRGWRYMGIHVWWRKNKRKKKNNVWMKERKRIRNDRLEIFSQYFYNKF